MQGAYRVGLIGACVEGRGANGSKREGRKERNQGKEDARSLCVLCESNSGEMAPSKLSEDEVSAIGEGIADVYGVVPTLDTVFPTLFVLVHDGMRARRAVGARVSSGGCCDGNSPRAGGCVDATALPSQCCSRSWTSRSQKFAEVLSLNKGHTGKPSVYTKTSWRKQRTNMSVLFSMHEACL